MAVNFGGPTMKYLLGFGQQELLLLFVDVRSLYRSLAILESGPFASMRLS